VDRVTGEAVGRRPRALSAGEHAHLPPEKVAAILDHLREGCGTRSTSRLVDVDKNTVTRYVRLAGTHADRLHQELVASAPGN